MKLKKANNFHRFGFRFFSPVSFIIIIIIILQLIRAIFLFSVFGNFCFFPVRASIFWHLTCQFLLSSSLWREKKILSFLLCVLREEKQTIEWMKLNENTLYVFHCFNKQTKHSGLMKFSTVIIIKTELYMTKLTERPTSFNLTKFDHPYYKKKCAKFLFFCFQIYNLLIPFLDYLIYIHTPTDRRECIFWIMHNNFLCV